MHPNRKLLMLSVVLSVWFLVVVHAATTFIVKQDGTGDYTSVITCMNSISNGDTCEARANTVGGTQAFAGGTLTQNGASGAYRTLTKRTGDTISISSALTITSRSYIKILNLEFTGTGVGIQGGSNSFITVDSNYLHTSGSSGCLRFTDDTVPGTPSNRSSDLTITNNTIYHCGWTSSPGSTSSFPPGAFVYGDRVLYANNDTSHTADCLEVGGDHVVLRNNSCHDVDAAELNTTEHIDNIQIIGGATPTLTNSLIEGNTFKNCANNSGNCHVLLVRMNIAQAPANQIIVRYNFGYNLDGSGLSFGGSTDDVRRAWPYNNTIATLAHSATNGDCMSYQNATNGHALNNICYETLANGTSPTVFSNTNTGDLGNYNVAYNSGYSGTWNSPYSTEATYATLRNVNPLFTDITSGTTLASNSTLINAGGPLTTTNGSGTSSTNLALTSSAAFQDGLSVAGVVADWLCVGTVSNCAQVSSIDHTTNIVVLVTGLTWTSGQSVWLYKKSDGAVVLAGSAPDIGAYEYGVASVVSPQRLRFMHY